MKSHGEVLTPSRESYGQRYYICWLLCRECDWAGDLRRLAGAYLSRGIPRELCLLVLRGGNSRRDLCSATERECEAGSLDWWTHWAPHYR